MLCDCNRNTTIVIRPDGLELCQKCRSELELTNGTWCTAWAERDWARTKAEIAAHYGPDFTPAQGSHHRESPNRVKRNEWRPGGAK